jgi:hypothetical protein
MTHLDLQEHGCQFGAAGLHARAEASRRGEGLLGWGGCREVPHLYREEFRVCFRV